MYVILFYARDAKKHTIFAGLVYFKSENEWSVCPGNALFTTI